MTPFETYWIMQLSTLRDACSVFLFLALITLAFSMFVYFVTIADGEASKPAEVVVKSRGLWAATVFCALFLIFAPSTKSMILIKVVPAITSPQAVEMSQELLNEARDALRALIKPKSGRGGTEDNRMDRG
jgi:hypothetical protein